LEANCDTMFITLSQPYSTLVFSNWLAELILLL
jgi:hypothetical protein